MPHVSNDDISKFDQAFKGAVQRLGNGKVGIDSNAVRALVRQQKAAAYRYVELHCHAAVSQPGLLQVAIIIAGAYQVEFNDDSLMRMVTENSQELNAGEHLNSIGFSPNMAEATKSANERQAAIEWWKTSDMKEGICDSCRSPMRRGEGYLLDGRVSKIGNQVINHCLELLCYQCFEKHRNAPRKPRR